MRSSLLIMLSLALGWAVTQTTGCVADKPLTPFPTGSTGSVTGGSTTLYVDTGASETDGGPDLGTETCDPLVDPLVECGPAQRCDLVTLTCVPATGANTIDEPCTGHDDCLPALACSDGRCRALCDPTSPANDTCEDSRLCTHADDPLPGLCLEPCVLVAPACPVPTDACKRALGPGLELVTVCTHNPGAGLEGDACESDGDCNPGYLCTPADLHTLPCANEAPFCCAPICDLLDLVCFGLEPVCHLLGIEGQENTGVCSAA